MGVESLWAFVRTVTRVPLRSSRQQNVPAGEDLLPLGLSEGCILKHDILADSPLKYDDVELAEDSNIVKLRKLQDQDIIRSRKLQDQIVI